MDDRVVMGSTSASTLEVPAQPGEDTGVVVDLDFASHKAECLQRSNQTLELVKNLNDVVADLASKKDKSSKLVARMEITEAYVDELSTNIKKIVALLGAQLGGQFQAHADDILANKE